MLADRAKAIAGARGVKAATGGKQRTYPAFVDTNDHEHGQGNPFAHADQLVCFFQVKIKTAHTQIMGLSAHPRKYRTAVNRASLSFLRFGHLNRKSGARDCISRAKTALFQRPCM